MKKQLLITAMLFTGFCALKAQDWSTSVYHYGEKYPGYIIKLEGDTVQGYIEYQYDRFKAQNNVEFYTDPKNKKTKVVYKGDDLKGYKVADKVYRSIAYSGGLLPKPMRFNLLVKDGRIAIYRWYDRNENYLTMMKSSSETQEEFEKRLYPDKEIYAKGNEKPFDSSNFGLKFAKFWAEQTSDYAEMSAKIANKDKGYGLLKIYEIIDEYNAWYAKK